MDESILQGRDSVTEKPNPFPCHWSGFRTDGSPIVREDHLGPRQDEHRVEGRVGGTSITHGTAYHQVCMVCGGRVFTIEPDAIAIGVSGSPLG